MSQNLPYGENSGCALPGAVPLAGYHASKGRPHLNEANQFGYDSWRRKKIISPVIEMNSIL